MAVCTLDTQRDGALRIAKCTLSQAPETLKETSAQDHPASATEPNRS